MYFLAKAQPLPLDFILHSSTAVRNACCSRFMSPIPKWFRFSPLFCISMHMVCLYAITFQYVCRAISYNISIHTCSFVHTMHAAYFAHTLITNAHFFYYLQDRSKPFLLLSSERAPFFAPIHFPSIDYASFAKLYVTYPNIV